MFSVQRYWDAAFFGSNDIYVVNDMAKRARHMLIKQGHMSRKEFKLLKMKYPQFTKYENHL
jgi:hypothetical protein